MINSIKSQDFDGLERWRPVLVLFKHTLRPPKLLTHINYAGRASHPCSTLAWFNWLPLSVVATPLQWNLLPAITHLWWGQIIVLTVFIFHHRIALLSNNNDNHSMAIITTSVSVVWCMWDLHSACKRRCLTIRIRTFTLVWKHSDYQASYQQVSSLLHSVYIPYRIWRYIGGGGRIRTHGSN